MSRRSTALSIIGFSAAVGVGALAFEGMTTDGRGKTNVDIGGVVQFGDCAKLLDQREIKRPVTDAQLLSNIKSIGRVCGYCVESSAVNYGGVSYSICIDPETISLGYDQAPNTEVQAFMTTEPASPEGTLFEALDTNPGFCSSVIAELEGNMSEYFGQAFGQETAGQLIPIVNIAPGSSSSCETA
jgi:hypothetical protein